MSSDSRRSRVLRHLISFEKHHTVHRQGNGMDFIKQLLASNVSSGCHSLTLLDPDSGSPVSSEPATEAPITYMTVNIHALAQDIHTPWPPDLACQIQLRGRTGCPRGSGGWSGGRPPPRGRDQCGIDRTDRTDMLRTAMTTNTRALTCSLHRGTPSADMGYLAEF